MNPENKKEVIQWAIDNGGHCQNEDDYKYHASRFLHEVVELCLASGMSTEEIIGDCLEEITKQSKKTNNKMDIADEIADSAILLEIFAHHTNLSIDDAVANKLLILYTRKWKIDKHGVIWRNKWVDG